MAILKPFKGIRPKKENVKQIASKPYDVLNEKEARAEAGDNQYSFYHVIKLLKFIRRESRIFKIC
jgi:uncharacterized protein (DUF1015 family)